MIRFSTFRSVKNFALNKGWHHVIAWTALYLIMVTIFSTDSNHVGEVMMRTAILFFTQAVIFYLNLLVLMPKFLERKRYLLYGESVILLVGLVMWILHALEPHYVPDHILAERSEVFRHLPREGKGLFRHGHMVVQGLSMFGTLFLSSIVRNISERRKKEQEKINLENKMLEAESKMLKSQLNPHFLFNALNNIYSLSQMKSDKTPESIHKLSNMLRYVLYDCDTEKVSLKQEIDYIESYVQLQLLKDEESSNNVKVDIDNVNGKLQITPMLLITFIENCFKHSNFEDIEKNWIEIKLSTEGNFLTLIAKNSDPGAQVKDKVGGVGLENVKRRLELAYPGKYTLKIKEEDKIYEVELTMDLSEN